MRTLFNAISSGRLNVALSESDYKSLLSDVSDARDSKYGDFFYDTLERVLNELKSMTDNNDAAAFQKPVSRQEAPDYHDIIAHPMDLATMSKKIKQRQYKTKGDFARDLGLIWDNCLKYNVGKDHYLRGCANRMRAKANKLLEHVSDRRERNDPATFLANETASPPKQNGLKLVLNGTGGGSKKVMKTFGAATTGSSPGARSSTMTPNGRSPPGVAVSKSRRTVSFGDRTAPERSDSAMTEFQELDAELARYMASLRPGAQPYPSRDLLVARLRTIIETDERFIDGGVLERADDEKVPAAVAPPADDNDEPVVAPPPIRPTTGGKRSFEDELKAFVNGLDEGVIPAGSKRKRSSSDGSDETRHKRARMDLPAETEPLSNDPVELWWQLMRTDSMLGGGLPTLPPPPAPDPPTPKLRRIKAPAAGTKNGKAKTKAKLGQSKSLLSLMNRNIRTLKRVQRIHDKFAILKEASEGIAPPPLEPLHEEDPAIYRRWRPRGRVMDSTDAWNCMQWSTSKILQHSGFNSSSQNAMNVLAGVAEEFLGNVGKTLRYYCDNYSQNMSGEEIVLHTLFESGISDVSDLERYITDDVVRYGSKLSDLERKLENAYRDVTVVGAEELAELDENGEDITFGNFGEDLEGEDFFGFKAMGLDKELGLRTLSIPTRLWNAKKSAQLATQTRSGPKELLPFPPPPPFLVLETNKIHEQIGLLHGFYINKARAAAPPPPPPLAVSAPIPAHIQPSAPQSAPPAPAPLPPAALPAPPAPISPQRPPPPAPIPPPTTNGFSLPSTNAIPYAATQAQAQSQSTPNALPSTSAIPFHTSSSLPSTSSIPFHTAAPAAPVTQTNSLPSSSAIPYSTTPTNSLPSTSAIPYAATTAASAASAVVPYPAAGQAPMTVPYGAPVPPGMPAVIMHAVPMMGGMAGMGMPMEIAMAPVIPDDVPDPLRLKIGTLGQIVVPGAASAANAAAKKAKKEKEDEKREREKERDREKDREKVKEEVKEEKIKEKEPKEKPAKESKPKEPKEKKEPAPKARSKKKKVQDAPAPLANAQAEGNGNATQMPPPMGPGLKGAAARPSPYPGAGVMIVNPS